MRVMVSHYLTDPKAWFVVTDVPKGLRYFWRKKPMFTNDGDFDALILAELERKATGAPIAAAGADDE